MSKSPLAIPREKVELSYSRSGGAGGQHVNKVETKAELRFRLLEADWIPAPVRMRMHTAYATRINREGEIIISSEETRSQIQNAEICFEKLASMIEACWRAPKKRIKTKPTRASREKRLGGKKHHSDKKKLRGSLD
jgi:ribosome-associated protein